MNNTSSDKYKKRDLNLDIGFERFEEDFYANPNTMFIVPNVDDIKEDLYYCPTCQRILELTEIDSCMNTPNEIIDYCLKCHSEVVNLKDNT